MKQCWNLPNSTTKLEKRERLHRVILELVLNAIFQEFLRRLLTILSLYNRFNDRISPASVDRLGHKINHQSIQVIVKQWVKSAVSAGE
jgi:DNA-binding GntR family transcriptional regulator